MKRLFFFFLLIGIASSLKSQTAYPQNYFRAPLDLRILLSGTFGELRSDHFHTGIDIKTRGVEGVWVFAAAEGYVSRVKVSPFGTGKTIYLTHPNGYVSVYGHLSKFEDSLAQYVEHEQYARQSFSVDLFPEKNRFHYAKGQLIAYSGNSGSSGGPHLHFEIRDGRTQEPINPLLFGIQVKDYIRPTIQSIRIYPDANKPFNLELAGWGEQYRLKAGDTIGLPKRFYLGINTIDKQNDTKNNNGVFEVNLFLDSVQIYGNRQERLNFSTGRYINAFIDYAYYYTFKRRYQKAYVGEQNKLDIYTKVKNQGLITLSDTNIHKISYQVKDANGNVSVLSFYCFKDDAHKFESLPEDTLKKAVFYPNQENVYQTNKLKLVVPAHALYDTMNFHFDQLPADKISYTPIYQIGRKQVPLQSSIQLSIESDSFPESIRSKLLLADIDQGRLATSKLSWDKNKATASIRSFGNYTLVADTVPPLIKWIQPPKTKDGQQINKLSFSIKDELSGIESYSAFLNGKWVLFEYDAKNNLIFH
ncbi:MAG: M23 family metallopeptidase, partial [Bacteroidales bacterium]|nr:M23 family metallopeptidase [Bacteroidales bacterium]